MKNLVLLLGLFSVLLLVGCNAMPTVTEPQAENEVSDCSQTHTFQVLNTGIYFQQDSETLNKILGTTFLVTQFLNDELSRLVGGNTELTAAGMINMRARVRNENEMEVKRHVIPLKDGELFVLLSRTEKSQMHYYNYVLKRKDLPNLLYISFGRSGKEYLGIMVENMLDNLVSNLCYQKT